MEGLGNLKGFIKARNTHTLEKATQAAREEEKIKISSEESKHFYQTAKRGTESYNTVKKPNEQCHVCKRLEYWAQYCRFNNTGNLTC